MKTIILLVAPNGAIQVETRDFASEACREASRYLERSLGRATTETLTTEYYQVESAETTVEHRAAEG